MGTWRVLSGKGTNSHVKMGSHARMSTGVACVGIGEPQGCADVWMFMLLWTSQEKEKGKHGLMRSDVSSGSGSVFEERPMN